MMANALLFPSPSESRPYLALFEVSDNNQRCLTLNTALKIPFATTHVLIAFSSPCTPFYPMGLQQILCEHAKIIGEESKDQEWIKTAENLRLPYWDWAIRKMLPPFLTTPTIDVLKPDGTTETLQQSPLFSYTFREGAASIRTVRPPNGASTFRVGQWLDDEDSWVLTEEIRDNVILMFKNIHDWYNFSNDAQLVSRAEAAAHANSLEAIHDDVHGAVGGFMGAVPKAGVTLQPCIGQRHVWLTRLILGPSAAFDPVFWVCHSPFSYDRTSEPAGACVIDTNFVSVAFTPAPSLQHRQILRTLASTES